MANAPVPLGSKTVIVLAPALADIDEQLAYIARTAGLDVALGFADAIDRALANLAFFGHSGVSREWIRPGLRMSLLGDHCIYFRVTPTETRIVRFLRASRDLASLSFDD